jgi:hypothetical protein
MSTLYFVQQLSCEGPLGKTSLFDAPPGPGANMRSDEELKGTVSSIYRSTLCIIAFKVI